MRLQLDHRPGIAAGAVPLTRVAGPRGRRWKRWAILFAIATVVALLGIGGLKLLSNTLAVQAEANQAKGELLAGATIVRDAGAKLTPAQLTQAIHDFRLAERHFRHVRGVLTASRSFAIMARVPLARRQISAATDLSDIGIHGAVTGRLMAEAVSTSLLEPLPNAGNHLDPGQKILALLDLLDPKLNQLTSELDLAVADRARIPSFGLLPQISTAVRQLDAKIDLKALRTSLLALRADEPGVRQLLGATGPRSYLVLEQDPAELRGTGGFIGSVAFLGFDRGKMAPFDPQDIDKLDENPNGTFVLGGPGTKTHVNPPYPLEYTFKLQSWELRDANWSPDFPTASRQAEFLLNRERGTKVDGVIAIDPYFIQRLLAIVGPVSIPETGDVVDQHNFFDVTLSRVELTTSNRKAFLSYASKQILGRVLSLPVGKWFSVLQAIQSGCDARSVQAYFHDPQTEALATKHQCGGQVQAPSGDGLMVIESNVGGNKDDFWMKRKFNLQIKMNQDGSVRHTLHLHYEGLTDRGYKLTGRWGYTGWLRIYAPASSTLVSTTGTDLNASQELGKTVFEGWFYVQFDHRVDLTVVYDVKMSPTALSQRQLRLFWQKQAGRVDDPISVELSLPDGWKLKSARMGSSSMPVGRISTSLSSDRQFVFALQKT